MFSLDLFEAFEELNKLYEAEENKIEITPDMPQEVVDLIMAGAPVYREEDIAFLQPELFGVSLNEACSFFGAKSHYLDHVFPDPQLAPENNPRNGLFKYDKIDLDAIGESGTNIMFPYMPAGEYIRRAQKLAEEWVDQTDSTGCFVCQSKDYKNSGNVHSGAKQKTNYATNSTAAQSGKTDIAATDRGSSWRICKYKLSSFTLDFAYFKQFRSNKDAEWRYPNGVVLADYGVKEVVYYNVNSVPNINGNTVARTKDIVILSYLQLPEKQLRYNLSIACEIDMDKSNTSRFSARNIAPKELAKDYDSYFSNNSRQTTCMMLSFAKETATDKAVIKCDISNNYQNMQDKFAHNLNAFAAFAFNGERTQLITGNTVGIQTGNIVNINNLTAAQSRQRVLTRWIRNYGWGNNATPEVAEILKFVEKLFYGANHAENSNAGFNANFNKKFLNNLLDSVEVEYLTNSTAKVSTPKSFEVYLNNGNLQANYTGNKIEFPSQDIISVYFDGQQLVPISACDDQISSHLNAPSIDSDKNPVVTDASGRKIGGEELIDGKRYRYYPDSYSITTREDRGDYYLEITKKYDLNGNELPGNLPRRRIPK